MNPCLILASHRRKICQRLVGNHRPNTGPKDSIAVLDHSGNIKRSSHRSFPYASTLGGSGLLERQLRRSLSELWPRVRNWRWRHRHGTFIPSSNKFRQKPLWTWLWILSMAMTRTSSFQPWLWLLGAKSAPGTVPEGSRTGPCRERSSSTSFSWTSSRDVTTPTISTAIRSFDVPPVPVLLYSFCAFLSEWTTDRSLCLSSLYANLCILRSRSRILVGWIKRRRWMLR